MAHTHSHRAIQPDGNTDTEPDPNRNLDTFAHGDNSSQRDPHSAAKRNTNRHPVTDGASRAYHNRDTHSKPDPYGYINTNPHGNGHPDAGPHPNPHDNHLSFALCQNRAPVLPIRRTGR